jgi:hypothetical protein
MNLEIYQRPLEMNAGLDQIVRGLATSSSFRGFMPKELDRYSALVKEPRASTNSYLLGIVEQAETKEAARRFGKRRDRELRE